MRAIKNICGTCTGGLSDRPQIVIFGLDGSGKTLLLYKLCLGEDWADKDVTFALVQMRQLAADGTTLDPGFHVEDLTILKGCYVWDIPGTPAMMQIWPTFYRTIKYHAVIYVVNSEEKEERISLARQQLHYLMNEDDLRLSCFVVIINFRDTKKRQKAKGAPDSQDIQTEMMKCKLGLDNLHPTCAWRTKVFPLDVMLIDKENDAKFAPIVQFLKETLVNPKGHAMKL
jgi:hypothetical protein